MVIICTLTAASHVLVVASNVARSFSRFRVFDPIWLQVTSPGCSTCSKVLLRDSMFMLLYIHDFVQEMYCGRHMLFSIKTKCSAAWQFCTLLALLMTSTGTCNKFTNNRYSCSVYMPLCFRGQSFISNCNVPIFPLSPSFFLSNLCVVTVLSALTTIWQRYSA